MGVMGLVGVGGCAQRQQIWHENVNDLPYPFAPAAMRIHPLTHLDRGAEGELVIVCYLDLRDAWGDPAKGIGRLELKLYGPEGPRGELPVEQWVWELDLTDLAVNHQHYDRATRTYRVQLVNLPEWVETILAGGGPGERRVILQAMFETPARDGQSEYIWAERILRP